MTTTEQVARPCNTDRCEYVMNVSEPGADGPVLCGYEREDHPVPRQAGAFYNLHHEFFKHTHTPACDAEFWALMGCDVRTGEGPPILACVSDDREHLMGHRRVYRTLAPILSAPETDESWRAMRDVLAEYEEWDAPQQVAFIGHFIQRYDFHDQIRGSVWDLPAVLMLLVRHFEPRAVAEAVKAALEAQGGK